MFSQRTNKRTLVLVLSSFALVAISISLYLVSRPADAHVRPPVRWETGRIEATIRPGETQTIPVTLTAGRDLPAMSAFVSPRLRDYVEVATSTIGPLRRGQTVTIPFTISAPPNTLPDAALGLVFLVVSPQAQRPAHIPVPWPLLVSVKVVWSSIDTPLLPFRMQYPSNWTNTIESQGVARLEGPVTTTPASVPGDMGGLCKVVIRSYANSNAIPLSVWAMQERGNNGAPLPVSSESTSVGGREALREVVEEIGVTTIVSIATNAQTVTSLQLLCGDSGFESGNEIFDAMLRSVVFR